MILMEDIIDEYHENIRKPSQPVTFPLSEEDKKILHDLKEYVLHSIDDDLAEKYQLRPSVGIAAPQINILKQLSVVAAYDEHGEYFECELINPKIIRHANFLRYLSQGEGCLSVNRQVPGIVPRYEKITIRNFDYDGNSYTRTFEGYAAIVIQHEIDHLHGILFMDRINADAPLTPPKNSAPIIFDDEVYDDDDELDIIAEME